METKAKNELTLPQRFTNAVALSYKDIACGLELTKEQRQLVAGYYIKLDEMLRNSKQQYTWKQVRIKELAVNLAHMAKLNLDMALNHLSFIPFKHGETGTIDLVAVIGRSGYEYIAKTYGLDPPKNVVVELVYETDNFTVIKKDSNHDYDFYVFEIVNPFNRGKIVGGFGYLEYDDKSKNKIIVMSESDILKYRPKYYDQTFWSGENMKKMYEKTIAKQLLKRIVLDPNKVSSMQDSFNKIESEEINYSAHVAKDEIENNMCQGDIVDVEFEPATEPSKAVASSETSNDAAEQNSLFNERSRLDEGELL